MSIVSESSPSLRHRHFAGRRRVSAAVAVPIVLMCGTLGFVLGSVYPPEVLFSREQLATRKAPATPAQTVATPSPVAAPPPASRPAAHAIDSFQQNLPSAPPLPTILNRTSPDLSPPAERASPAPMTTPQKTAVEGIRPGSRPLAVIGDESAARPEHTGVEPTRDAEKEIKKADRRSGEKRRAARPKRQQYAEPAPPAAAAQSKGLFSQIPIIGPVVGLVLP